MPYEYANPDLGIALDGIHSAVATYMNDRLAKNQASHCIKGVPQSHGCSTWR